MPKSVHIFLFLLITCSLLVCLYYSEIEKNVSRHFGPHLLGSNLRNLRSSEEVLAVTGASVQVTPLASVKHEEHGDRQNATNPLVYHYSVGSKNESQSLEVIHLALIFCNAQQKVALKWNFKRMIRSLIKHCYKHTPLHIHLVTDLTSWEIAKEIVHHEAKASKLNIHVSAYFIDTFSEEFKSIIQVLQQYFSSKQGTYYSQALFFVSVWLPNIIPTHVRQIAFVDVDTEFHDSIGKLYQYFELFNGEQLLGLAPELSPVYRHILYVYRNQHKSSLLGEPKGKGFPGYNSGVVLMKLDKLRESVLYQSLLTNSSLANLTEKYTFKGHLGDQDFYTLIALEYPHLFFTLPCNWNRQLCQWWKSKGYDDIFDLFYECKGFISLYHGNCDSPIPETT